MDFLIILLCIIAAPFAIAALGLSAALIVGTIKGLVQAFPKKGGK